MRGSSMTDIGAYNEKLVLQMIREAPEGIGQAEVVRRSNLSRQAVSLITRRLLAEGLVETAGRQVSGRGKPSTLLRVVADARLAIGVHLDPAYVSVVVCDLLARPLAGTRLPAPSDDPAQDIGQIGEAIDQLAARIGAVRPPQEPGQERNGRRLLLGVGIAAPAALDSTTGVVIDPPWIPGWRNVAVVDALQAATGLPCLLDKDTNAVLTGEIWTEHLPSDETVLYIYVGHGVGSAVSGGRQVHRGGTTQAGEIGHLPIGRADRRCTCGRHGCLGLYTDALRLMQRAREAGVHLPADIPVPQAMEAIGESAGAGHPGACSVIREHGAALGEALQILVGIHDPDRIIVGGPTWMHLREHGMPPIREALAEWTQQGRAEPDSSRLGNEAGAVGAASLFLDQELAPETPTAAAGQPVGRPVAAV